MRPGSLDQKGPACPTCPKIWRGVRVSNSCGRVASYRLSSLLDFDSVPQSLNRSFVTFFSH